MVPTPRRLAAPKHDPTRDMTKFTKSRENGYQHLPKPESAERRQLHVGDTGCAWKWAPKDVHGQDVGSVRIDDGDRQKCEAACMDHHGPPACNAFVVTTQITCDLKHIPKQWWNFYGKDAVPYSADAHQHEEETGRDLYLMDKECAKIRAPNFESGPMDPKDWKEL